MGEDGKVDIIPLNHRLMANMMGGEHGFRLKLTTLFINNCLQTELVAGGADIPTAHELPSKSVAPNARWLSDFFTLSRPLLREKA